ncbi:MAG: hypothetical protein RMJ55_13790, partial [Roseiflexaceae bacterium]|nr:hypothetical protein [Roseiflexaceae bacterium]
IRYRRIWPAKAGFATVARDFRRRAPLRECATWRNRFAGLVKLRVTEGEVCLRRLAQAPSDPFLELHYQQASGVLSAERYEIGRGREMKTSLPTGVRRSSSDVLTTVTLLDIIKIDNDSDLDNN